MGEAKKYHGHKTMPDGSHVPLTENEAAELWKYIEAEQARRAEELPTAQDALRAIVRAQERLKELGWWKGGGLRVQRGDKCAVAESGSTGMWKGWLDGERKYVHYCDSVSSPENLWLKPLPELTDDERALMDECDKREAEAHSAMIDTLAGLPTSGDAPEPAPDVVEALERSIVAIDDWLHQFAPDECKPHYVTETRNRITSGGGTLAYIADVQQQNREALAHAQAGWRSMDSAPHNENVLLAYWDDAMNHWHMEAGMASWGWRRDGVSNMSRHGQATHWMPLPSAPGGQ